MNDRTPVWCQSLFQLLLGREAKFRKNLKEREKNKNKSDLGVSSDFKEFTNWPKYHVHNNLKQEKRMTVDVYWVQGKKKFPCCGEQVKLLVNSGVGQPWKIARHRDGKKGISNKGRIMRKVAEMQTWNTYTKRRLVRCQLETIHRRWFLWRTILEIGQL